MGASSVGEEIGFERPPIGQVVGGTQPFEVAVAVEVGLGVQNANTQDIDNGRTSDMRDATLTTSLVIAGERYEDEARYRADSASIDDRIGKHLHTPPEVVISDFSLYEPTAEAEDARQDLIDYIHGRERGYMWAGCATGGVALCGAGVAILEVSNGEVGKSALATLVAAGGAGLFYLFRRWVPVSGVKNRDEAINACVRASSKLRLLTLLQDELGGSEELVTEEASVLVDIGSDHDEDLFVQPSTVSEGQAESAPGPGTFPAPSGGGTIQGRG